MACCWLHFCMRIRQCVNLFILFAHSWSRQMCSSGRNEAAKANPALTPFRSAKVLVHFHQRSLEWIVRGQSAPLASSASHACIAISRRKFASANRCSKNDSAAAAAGPPSIIYPLPWHNTEWIAAGPQHTLTTHNTRARAYTWGAPPPYAQWNCNCARAHYFFINARARMHSICFYLEPFIYEDVVIIQRCDERVIARWPQVLSPRARISIRWGVFLWTLSAGAKRRNVCMSCWRLKQ